MIERAESWHAVFRRIVDGAHLADADDVLNLVDDAAAGIGLSVRLYLVDLAQRQLHPVRPGTGPSLLLEATTAGRAFRLTEIIPVEAPASDGGRPYLWLPLLNGTERLGVVQMVLPAGLDPADGRLRGQCWTLAGLLGHLVMSKLHYSDLFHVVRRTEPLSVASELLWQLLPPQTFACERMVVTAVVEPHNQVGGDGYDYAVDAHRAHVAIFDAMGHDMLAGLTTAVALAATRNARRSGLGLVEAAALADEAIGRQAVTDYRMPFATAVLADLDLDTGVLEYLNAGHPPPVLLRQGKRVRSLNGPVRPPLGLGHLVVDTPQVAREHLQPGDRILFHSDGVTEARSPEGDLFGLERLVDLTERHESAGLPAPETLRRVARAVLEHQRGQLQDDATLLLLEWSTAAPNAALPRV